jgi:hypothetical protein
MPKRKSNDEFIRDCKKTHGDKYNYSKCEYKGNRTKVVISCPEHGDFEQIPHNHIEGKGCPMCGGSKKHDIFSFIEKSKLKHNNFYNYDSVIYINSNTKVKIKCPLHGYFEQCPIKHINGSGCQNCGGTKKMNTVEFIQKSSLKHGTKYDYKLVDYINNKTKVEIICRDHGYFLITPSNHLKGVGCSKCSGKRKLTTGEFVEMSKLIHDNKYLYNNTKYVNHKSSLIITCRVHGDFNQIANHHLSGHGCKKCKESRGEFLIEKFLTDKKLNYKKQYEFENLMFKKKLRFDFAVLNSDDTLDCLIEYNGQQHYSFRGQFGMKLEDFNKILLRDKMKLDYCLENKIDIFIIRYDEDVNYRLNQIFTEKTEHSSEFSVNHLM